MIRKLFSYLLLLCLVVKGASSAMADEVFKKYSGNLTEGEYLISYNGHLMKATVANEKLDDTFFMELKTKTEFSNPDANLVWTIKADGNYFTLYNASTQKYAASTGKDSQATLASEVNDKARWTVSGTYDFINKANRSLGKNAYLRYFNEGYGCYNPKSGGALVLFKKEVATSPLSSIALSGSYPTEFTEGMEFSHEGMTVTATYEDESTKDVTAAAQFSGYDMTTVGSQTITVNYTEGEVTASATYSITVKAIPSYQVTWSVNGVETVYSYREGETIVFPDVPNDINGKTFMGWTTEAIVGTTDDQPVFTTNATMGTSNLVFYAVFARKTVGDLVEVIDVLTNDLLKQDSYGDWSGITDQSGAVYAGYTAGDATLITFGKGKPNGIVTTTSGGRAITISTTWGKVPIGGTSITVYGKNTPYTSTEELYDSDKMGKELGTITRSKPTLSITESYEYIGFVAKTKTTDIVSISITWSKGTSDTFSEYCTSVDNLLEPTIAVQDVQITYGETFTIEESMIDGGDITVTSSNEQVATVEGFVITAKAVGTSIITVTTAENETYRAGSASFVLTVTADESEPSETPATVDVTLAASGYVSYCSPYALDLTPSNAYAAWTVTAVEGTSVTFTKIKGAVPARTPFILYSEVKKGETVSLPVTSGETQPVVGNMLKGTTAPTFVKSEEDGYTNFGLSNGSFKRMTDGVVKANKAYLPVLTENLPDGSENARWSIVFDEEVTAIRLFTVSGADSHVFTLSGKRVADKATTKGIFIENGKKVIKK